jgi:hypothetical protein
MLFCTFSFPCHTLRTIGAKKHSVLLESIYISVHKEKTVRAKSKLQQEQSYDQAELRLSSDVEEIFNF